MRVRKRALVQKFFADRGTHLAAMIAYFALLSFVPLVFLALSLLGLAHRAEASDFFVRELKHAFPGRSEEHTSELQSHVNLVCRLLLEKKNHCATEGAAVWRLSGARRSV